MSAVSIELHYPLPEDGHENPVDEFYSKIGAEVTQDTGEEGFRYVSFGDACLHFYGRPADSSHSYFGEFFDDEISGRGVEISIDLGDDFPLKTYFNSLVWLLPANRFIRHYREHAGGHELRVRDPFGYMIKFSQGIDLECEPHRPQSTPAHEAWNPFPQLKQRNPELFWLPRSLTHPVEARVEEGGLRLVR